MKKIIILIGIMAIFTCSFAQIQKKIFTNTIRIGYNSNMGMNQSNEIINTVSPSGAINFDSVYGITKKFGIGLGLGIITENVTYKSAVVNNLKQFYGFKLDNIFASSPIYIVGEYDFNNIGSMTPYVIGRFGYSTGILPNDLETISILGTDFNSTLTIRATGGLYYSIGGGLYFNKNWSIGISANHVATGLKATGVSQFNGFSNSQSDTEDISFNNFEILVGYTF